MIPFETVWIRLNLLQTRNAYSRRVVFAVYLPRQCSATKPLYCSCVLSRFIWITLRYFILGDCKLLKRSKLAIKCKFLSGEGFEPSISMRVRLKLTALDRSANLTFYITLYNWKIIVVHIKVRLAEGSKATSPRLVSHERSGVRIPHLTYISKWAEITFLIYVPRV